LTTVFRRVSIALMIWVAAVAWAQGAGSGADEYPLRLEVGKSVALCSTGTLICPARDTRCDDASVVVAGADERGPVLKGVKEGTTLCSTGSASGQGARRVYRVTVVARPPAGVK
jgi:hypothetical protein